MPRLPKTIDRCTHKYVHLQHVSFVENVSYERTRFVSVDKFFCEKCLEAKEVKKEEVFGRHQLHELPDWAKMIDRQR